MATSCMSLLMRSHFTVVPSQAGSPRVSGLELARLSLGRKLKGNNMSLYTDCKALGETIDHHESDLYVKSSKSADALVKLHDTHKIATKFISNVDGKVWWDVPFSFDPYWESRCAK